MLAMCEWLSQYPSYHLCPSPEQDTQLQCLSCIREILLQSTNAVILATVDSPQVFYNDPLHVGCLMRIARSRSIIQSTLIFYGQYLIPRQCQFYRSQLDEPHLLRTVWDELLVFISLVSVQGFQSSLMISTNSLVSKGLSVW